MNYLRLEVISSVTQYMSYILNQDGIIIGKGMILTENLPEWVQMKIAVLQAFEGKAHMPGIGQRHGDRLFMIDVEPGEYL